MEKKAEITLKKCNATEIEFIDLLKKAVLLSGSKWGTFHSIPRQVVCPTRGELTLLIGIVLFISHLIFNLHFLTLCFHQIRFKQLLATRRFPTQTHHFCILHSVFQQTAFSQHSHSLHYFREFLWLFSLF